MNTMPFSVRSLFTRRMILPTVALLSAALLVSTASAQSSSRNARPGSGTKAGSGSRAADSSVGLQGYCPVCVVEMKKWVKGNPQFSVQQDGKTYLFPNEEQKNMFLDNPAKYTPVLGGDCVVALVEMGKRVPGSLQFAAVHENRLYLFANEKAKSMFVADTGKYADADLALGGKCSVCRVEMNQDVAGVPQFTSIYKGMRYQFPSDKQQQMFNQNPAKYDVAK